MNALPIKTPTPQDIFDDLVTEFGINKMLLATIARLFKRTRPPSIASIEHHPDVEHLSDRMRADIGLPPQDHLQQLKVDQIGIGYIRL